MLTEGVTPLHLKVCATPYLSSVIVEKKMKSITVSTDADLTSLDRLDILNIIYQKNPSPELKEWVLYGNQYVHCGASHISRTAWWCSADKVGEVDIYVAPAPTPEIAFLNREIAAVYELLYPKQTHLDPRDCYETDAIAELKNTIKTNKQSILEAKMHEFKTRKWELEMTPLRAWIDSRRAMGCTEVVLWPADLSTLMVEHGVVTHFNTKKKTVWFEPGNVRSPHPVCLSLKDPAPVVLNTSSMPRVVWDLEMRRDMLVAGTVKEPERVIRHLESLVIR